MFLVYSIKLQKIILKQKHEKDIFVVTTSKCDKFVYIGLTNGTVKKICTKKFIVLRSYHEVGGGIITSMLVSNDNKFMILQNYKTTMSQIDLDSGDIVKTYSGITSKTNSCVMTMDSRYVFSQVLINGMIQFSLEGKKKVSYYYEIHDHFIKNICMSQCGKYLFIISIAGVVKVFSIKLRKVIAVLEIEGNLA